MVVDITECIDKTCLAQTYRLDLCARKHNASRVGLDKEVLERSLLVFYAYRTFLSFKFLFLVHLIVLPNLL